jgi:malate dehydrogenase
MARKKIALIGAGMIGGTLAHIAAREELGDVVLMDLNEGTAKGKALDLCEASPVFGKDSHLTGGSVEDYTPIAGADVCIVTAGVPRKPGMSRDDLLEINLKVMKSVGEGIKRACPERVRDLHHQPAGRHGLGAARVLRPAAQQGLSAWRAFSTARASAGSWPKSSTCPWKDVTAFVIGGHGDTMVPLTRYSTIAGIPVPDHGRDGLVHA